MKTNNIKIANNKNNALKVERVLLMCLLFCLVLVSVCFTSDLDFNIAPDNQSLNVAEAALGDDPKKGRSTASSTYKLGTSGVDHSVAYDYANGSINYVLGPISNSNISMSYYSSFQNTYNIYDSNSIKSNYQNAYVGEEYREAWYKRSAFSATKASFESQYGIYGVSSDLSDTCKFKNYWSSVFNIELPDYLINFSNNYNASYNLTISGKMFVFKEYVGGSSREDRVFYLGYSKQNSTSIYSTNDCPDDSDDFKNPANGMPGATQINLSSYGYIYDIKESNINLGGDVGAVNEYYNNGLSVNNYVPSAINFSYTIQINSPTQMIGLWMSAYARAVAGCASPMAALYDLSIRVSDFSADVVIDTNSKIGYKYKNLSLNASGSTISGINQGSFNSTAISNRTTVHINNLFSAVVVAPIESVTGYRFSSISINGSASGLNYTKANDNPSNAVLICLYSKSNLYSSYSISKDTSGNYSMKTEYDSDTGQIKYFAKINTSNVEIQGTPREFIIRFEKGADDVSGNTGQEIVEYDEQYEVPLVSKYFTAPDNDHDGNPDKVGISWKWDGRKQIGSGSLTGSISEKYYIQSVIYRNIPGDLDTNLLTIYLSAVWSEISASESSPDFIIAGQSPDNISLYTDVTFTIKARIAKSSTENQFRILEGVYAKYLSGDLNGHIIALENTGTSSMCSDSGDDKGYEQSYWTLYGMCGKCELYPVWRMNTYQIVWNLNGGSATLPSYGIYGIGIGASDMPIPTKANNIFKGWSCTGSRVNIASSQADENSGDGTKIETFEPLQYIPWNAISVTCTASWFEKGSNYTVTSAVTNSSITTVNNNNGWYFQTSYGYSSQNQDFEYGTTHSSNGASGVGYYVECSQHDNTSDFYAYCPVYIGGELYYKLKSGLITATVQATATFYVGSRRMAGGPDSYSTGTLALYSGARTNPSGDLTYSSDKRSSSNYQFTSCLSNVIQSPKNSSAKYSSTSGTATTGTMTLDSSHCDAFTIMVKIGFWNDSTLFNSGQYGYASNLSYTITTSDRTVYRYTINPNASDAQGNNVSSANLTFSHTGQDGRFVLPPWSREGYEFVGWSTTTNGSVITNNILTPTSSNPTSTYYAIWRKNKYPLIIYDAFTDGATYKNVATSIKKEWYVNHGETINFGSDTSSTSYYANNTIYPEAGCIMGNNEIEYSGFSLTKRGDLFHRPFSNPQSSDNKPISEVYKIEYSTLLTMDDTESFAKPVGAIWACYVWTLDPDSISLSGNNIEDYSDKVYDGGYYNFITDGKIPYTSHASDKGYYSVEYRYFFARSATSNFSTTTFDWTFGDQGDFSTIKTAAGGALVGEKYYSTTNIDDESPIPSFKDVDQSGYFKVKIQYSLNKYNVTLYVTQDSDSNARGKTISAVINRRLLEISVSEYSSGSRYFDDISTGAANEYWYDALIHGYEYTLSGDGSSTTGLLNGESIKVGWLVGSGTTTITSDNNSFHFPTSKNAGTYTFSGLQLQDYTSGSNTFKASNYTTINGQISPASVDNSNSLVFDDTVMLSECATWQRSWTIKPREITITVNWSEQSNNSDSSFGPQASGYLYPEYNGKQQGVVSIKVTNYISGDCPIIASSMASSSSSSRPNESTNKSYKYVRNGTDVYYVVDGTFVTSSWPNNYSEYAGIWGLYLENSQTTNYVVKPVNVNGLATDVSWNNNGVYWEWQIAKRKISVEWYSTDSNGIEQKGLPDAKYEYNGSKQGVTKVTLSGFIGDEITSSVIDFGGGISTSYSNTTSSGTTRVYEGGVIPKTSGSGYAINLSIKSDFQQNYEFNPKSTTSATWDITGRLLTISVYQYKVGTSTTSSSGTYTYNGQQQGVYKIRISNMPLTIRSESGAPFYYNGAGSSSNGGWATNKTGTNGSSYSVALSTTVSTGATVWEYTVTGPINADTYKLIGYIKSSESGNYEWKAGTGMTVSSNSATTTWTIDQAPITVTMKDKSGNAITTNQVYEYNSLAQGIKTVVISGLADGETAKVSGSINPSGKSFASEINVTLTQATLVGQGTYSSGTVTYTITDTINATNERTSTTPYHKIAVAIASNKNYKWNSGSDVTLGWCIQKKDLTLTFKDVSGSTITTRNTSGSYHHYYYNAAYQGLETITIAGIQTNDTIGNVVAITPTVVGAPTLNGTTYTLSNLTKDFTSTTASAKVSLKSTNYVILNDTGEYYWRIDKVPIAITLGNSTFTYDGNVHTIEGWTIASSPTYTSGSNYTSTSTATTADKTNSRIEITYAGSRKEYINITSLPSAINAGTYTGSSGWSAGESTNLNNYTTTGNGSATLTINKRQLSIAWSTEAGNLTYNGSNQTLRTVKIDNIVGNQTPVNITCNGGGLVSDPSGTTLKTYTASAKNAGTYTITVALNSTDGKNYLITGQTATSSRTIDKKAITVKWYKVNKSGTKTDVTTTGKTNERVEQTYDAVYYTLIPTPDNLEAGDTVTINYSIALKTGYSSYGLGHVDGKYVIDANGYTFSFTNSDLQGESKDNYSIVGASKDMYIWRRVVTYAISVDGVERARIGSSKNASTDKYTSNSTIATEKLELLPKYADVSSIYSVTYDGATVPLQVVITGVSSADTSGNITFTLSMGSTNTNATYSSSKFTATIDTAKNANVYNIECNMSGSMSGNYTSRIYDSSSATTYKDVKGIKGSFKIEKRQLTSTLTNNSDTVKYNAKDQLIGTFTIDNVVSGDFPVKVTCGSDTISNPSASTKLIYNFNYKNAGKYSASVTLVDSVNYTLTGTTSLTDREINKAPLTIKANNKTITYGDAPTNAGVTYSGFVGGETESVLGGTLSYSYNYTQYGNVGTYKITPTGCTAENYEITYTTGDLVVNQKEVTITGWALTTSNPSDSTKYTTFTQTYDTYQWTMSATIGGLVNGDAVTIGTYTGNEETNAGSYTATATGLAGTKSGNYKLPSSASQAWTINKADFYVKGIKGYDRFYLGITFNYRYYYKVNSGSYSTGDVQNSATYNNDTISWQTIMSVTYADGSTGTQANNVKSLDAGTYIYEAGTFSAKVTSGGTNTTANYNFHQEDKCTGSEYNVKVKPIPMTIAWDSSSYVYNGETQYVNITGITSTAGEGYTTFVLGTQTSDSLTLTAKSTRSGPEKTITLTLDGAQVNAGTGYTMGASINSITNAGGVVESGSTAERQKANFTISTNPTKAYAIDKRPLEIAWTLDSNLTYSKFAKGLTATVSGGLSTEDPVKISKTNSGDAITLRDGGKGAYSNPNWTYRATAIDAKDNYSVTATLTNSNNYTITGDLVKTFNITKLVVTLTWTLSSDGNPNETSPVTYNGKTHTMLATINNAISGDAVTATYSAGNTGKDVGNYTTTVNGLTGAQSGNYTITGASNLTKTWVINPAKLTIEMKNKSGTNFTSSNGYATRSYTYNGSTQGVKYVYINGMQNGEVPTLNNVATPSGTAAKSVTIALKNLTATATNSNGNITYTISDTKDAKPASKYYYDITCAASGNYVFDTTATNYTYRTGWDIVPLPIEVAWKLDGTSTYTTTYSGVTHTMTAEISNKKGSDVISATYTNSGTKVHEAINVGTYTAEVNGLTGAQSNNYTLTGSTGLSQSWTINKAKLTITMQNIDGAFFNDNRNGKGSTNRNGNDNYRYDGTAKGVKTIIISGLQNGEVPTVNNVATPSGTAATSVNVALTNVTLANSSSVSGKVTYTLNDTINASASATNDYHLINCTIGDNYEWDTSATNYNYRCGWYVAPRIIEISWKLGSKVIGWTGDTPNNNTVPYDNLAHSVTATVANLVSGDSCNLNLSGDYTKTNAGSYTATVASAGNTNYTLTGATHASLTWQITKRVLSISWSSTSSFTYDKTSQGITATVTNELSNYDPVTIECTSANKANVTCGTGDPATGSTSRQYSATAINANSSSYTIKASLKDTDNYEFSGTTTKSFTIGKRTVTIEWSTTTTFVYNKELRYITATVSGGIGDEKPVTINGTGLTIDPASYDDTVTPAVWKFNRIGATDAGTYTATASIVNDNYQLSGDNASKSFTINPKTIGITWTNYTKEYDGSVGVPTATANNVCTGDSVPVTLSPTQTSSKNVGSYQFTASISNPNYVLNDTKTHSYTITKRVVTITWDTTSFTYDGKEHKRTGSVSNLVSGDTCALTYTYSDNNPINAGTYTVTVASVGNTNYTLPTDAITKEFTINRKDLYVDSVNYKDGGSASSPTCEYDGYNHGYTIGLRGLVSGESLRLAFTLEGSPTASRLSNSVTDGGTNKTNIYAKNKGTYSIKSFVVSDNGTNGLRNNYLFHDSATTLTWTISPVWIKTITPVLVNTKEYDATTDYKETKSATFEGRNGNDITSLVTYSMTAVFSDANVITANKTINYTITLSGDNYTFTDKAAVYTYEGSIPATITARTLTITMYLGNKKLYKTYDATNAFAVAYYTGSGSSNVNGIKTQKSRTYRAGQGFTIGNIPAAETKSITIEGIIAEVYNIEDLRTGISQNGMSTVSPRVNLDSFVNNTIYTINGSDELSNFRVSGNNHYKRLIFTTTGTVDKHNYKLSVVDYTVSGQEYDMSDSSKALIVYDKADKANNASGYGWSIAINKKTINASYTNTTQSYVNELDHSIKKQNEAYALASEVLSEYDATRKYYTRNGSSEPYTYEEVASKNASDFNTYYVNLMYEKIGCSSIAVESVDRNRVGINITNGWWNNINSTTFYEKYTAISGRAGNSTLGAKLTAGTDEVDASINYTLRNQPTLIIGYFVNYNKIDSLGALLLATHYYTNYKDFTVGYTFGWNTVLTAAEYEAGLDAFLTTKGTIEFTKTDETKVNVKYNRVYQYENGLTAFVDGIKYYTGVFTVVDQALEPFDSNIWYYTLNGDGSYTYVAGMKDYDSTITYYKATFTEVDLESAFDSGEKYYTISSDWDSWMDWYQRTYELYSGIEIELVQYDYLEEGEVDPDTVFTDPTKKGQWGIYESVPETWNEGATTIKYKEFVLSSNINGIYTAEDIELLDAQFGVGAWGVGKTALQNIIPGSVGSMCTAIGSIFTGTFDGIFDGAGYNINYINIIKYNNASYRTMNVGFFESIGATAIITNLNLRNTNIVVADTYALTKAEVINIGGIVGYSQSTTTMENVSFHGTITATTNGARVNLGGIIGNYTDASSTNGFCIIDNAVIAGTIYAVIRNGSNSIGDQITNAKIGGAIGNITYTDNKEAYINDIVSVASIVGETLHTLTSGNDYGAFVGQADFTSYYLVRGNSNFITNASSRLSALVTYATKDNTISELIASNTLMSNMQAAYINNAVGNATRNFGTGYANALASMPYYYYDSANHKIYFASDLSASANVYEFTYNGTTFDSTTGVVSTKTISEIGESKFTCYHTDYTTLRSKNLDVLKTYTSGKRDSMKVNDIIDAYVLMNGTTLNVGETQYVVNAGHSWIAGSAVGTTSSRFIIANQQNVSLLRMFKFMAFELRNEITLGPTTLDRLYFGSFSGDISTVGDVKIIIRTSDLTNYSYKNESNIDVARYLFCGENFIINATNNKNFSFIVDSNDVIIVPIDNEVAED